MSMIGRHRQHREQAEQARARFERRLTRMRGEVEHVTTRVRTRLRDNAPGLLPWVFSLGFLVGLWRPLTLRGLFRGGQRAGHLGHVVATGASAVLGSGLGREALATAQRLMTDVLAPHAVPQDDAMDTAMGTEHRDRPDVAGTGATATTGGTTAAVREREEEPAASPSATRAGDHGDVAAPTDTAARRMAFEEETPPEVPPRHLH